MEMPQIRAPQGQTAQPQEADGPQQSRKFIRNLQKEVRKLRIGGDVMDLFGDPVPKELLTEYKPEDLDSRLARTIQKKYKSRPVNIKRCWNRVQLFLP